MNTTRHRPTRSPKPVPTREPPSPAVDARPVFVVELKPLRPGDAAMVDLRRALKLLLRSYGLRCVGLRQIDPRAEAAPFPNGDKP